MAYSYYNPNPVGRYVEDCPVRALSKILDTDWETAKVILSNASFKMADMEHSNEVLAAVLRQNGFYRDVIPNECPDCYTADDFCNDHQKGKFVLFTSSHVIPVIDGVIYDTWDSGKEIPQFYWYKKEIDNNGNDTSGKSLYAANATNAKLSKGSASR